MADIRLLSPDLINKIAAGEVVERPASIVKELMENSLDASAKNIIVKVEQGGVNFIEVIDDGTGMNEQNAKLAFAQHATSKIHSEADLKRILTLGFRGEALASISSIAATTIHTKTSSGEPVFVSVENDRITAKSGSGRNTGTTITVKNVFQKIPARKKFLKSENVEYKHILAIFTKIALAHHTVSFSLYHNNKLIYSLQKTKTTEERIVEFFPNLKSKLIPISFSDKSINISGYIGHPSVNRKDKSVQYIFVNSRAVVEPVIAQAVKTGFGTNLMHNQNPVYFVMIEIDPERVDVNVHPRKNELRFDNSQEIFKIIYTCVRKALEKHLQTELKDRFQLPPTSTQNPLKQSFSSPDSDFSADNSQHDFPDSQQQSAKIGAIPAMPHTAGKSSYNTRTPAKLGDEPLKRNMGLDFTKNILTQTQELTDLLATEAPAMKALQVFNTYLIVENNRRLYIIDQHAAAERISYEKIKARFEKHESLPAQKLLIPEQITISKQEHLDLLEHKKQLTTLGFEFELKTNSIVLKSVPEIITSKNPQSYFDEILASLSEFNKVTGKEEISLLNNMIATIACHSSIRAGQKLDDFQIKTIINDLLQCKQPYSCPHGRPIIWIISQNELEKNFKRIP